MWTRMRRTEKEDEEWKVDLAEIGTRTLAWHRLRRGDESRFERATVKLLKLSKSDQGVLMMRKVLKSFECCCSALDRANADSMSSRR